MPLGGRAHAFGAAIVGAALIGACTAQAPRPGDGAPAASADGTPDPNSGSGGQAAHGETLGCLSSFVAAKCAVGGCHDDQTRSYGMDLSTGDSIFAAWVNRNGLDNCQSQLVPRVVPGDPDGSFVFRKITSQLDCVGSISQPMPPPPFAPLSVAEIEVIRSWIAAGAPMHCTAGEPIPSGGAPSVGGTAPSVGGSDATANGGTGATGGGSGGSATEEDPFKCDATKACTGQLICHADSCSTEVWDCVAHRPLPSDGQNPSLPPGYQPHHPCPTDTIEYCGCDGVTFVAPVTCPDRPYQHPGSCDEGFNCNPNDNLCAESGPTCDPGEAPSIVDECYATCVPATDCRCEFNWECPTGWQCDRTQWRCVLPPPVEGM